MSFVNLMASDVWSDADITNRTEAMIRSEFSDQAQQILNRKATGAALGQYVMTEEEQADLARFADIANAARAAGIEARSDMERLNAVLGYEAALARLARDPVTEPETVDVADQDGNTSTVPNPAIAQDAADRAAAQAVVDGASQDTLDLYALRNPPAPEPEPEPVPEVVE